MEALTYDSDGNRLSAAQATYTENYGYPSGNDLLTISSIAGTVVRGFGYTTHGSVNLLNPGSVAPPRYSITDLTYNQDARPSVPKSLNPELRSTLAPA